MVSRSAQAVCDPYHATGKAFVRPVKMWFSYLKHYLTAHKGESAPQLQQQITEVHQQSSLNIALSGSGSDRQEGKIIGVFKNLLSKI